MNKKQETFFDKFEKILTGNSRQEPNDKKKQDNNIEEIERSKNLGDGDGRKTQFNKLDIIELLYEVNGYKKGRKGKIIMVNSLYIMVEMFNDEEIQAKFRDKVIKVSSEQIKFVA